MQIETNKKKIVSKYITIITELLNEYFVTLNRVIWLYKVHFQ